VKVIDSQASDAEPMSNAQRFSRVQSDLVRVASGWESGVDAASRRWAVAVYAYGLVLVLGLAYVLLDMPIQVADGYTNMIGLGQRSLLDGVYSEFFQKAYLRPFLWGQQHVVYALARGRYFEWFRGWHVAQVLLLVILFIRVLKPRTIVDAAVLPLGLAILLGMHTFIGTVVEAFPINTFMTILLCTVGAADVALGPPTWWRGLAAPVLLVFAALTVESGLLVWVVFVAAHLTGARGVSRRTVLALTVMFAGYFVLRFGVLDVGSPGLIERSSGYGFRSHDPQELIAMFGAEPWRFYGYNVVTSILSVLWSEPRAGVWDLTQRLVEHVRISRPMLVNVISSTLATGVLVRFAWTRRLQWRKRLFERADRIVLIFASVLVANAALSYAYTKDVVMSPAGVFYALAVTVAVRELISEGPRAAGVTVVIAMLIAAMSAAWAVRAVAVHVAVRQSGMAVREQWAYLDQWLDKQEKTASDPAALELQRQLQDDAIVRHPGRPALTGEWMTWLEGQ
jgi:hypothetical protein